MDILNFFSRDAGQKRREKLDQYVDKLNLERFLPPNLRPAGGLLVEANPVSAVGGAMQSASVAFDPKQTAEARKRAAVDMGVEMAMTLAPTALVRMGYLAAPAGLMETFATPSVDAAVDMGRGLLSDATYAARSIGKGNPRGVLEAFQRGGEAKSLSAASSDAVPTIRAFHGSPHDFSPAVRVLDKETGKTYVQEVGDPVTKGIISQNPDRYEIIEERPLGMFDISRIGTGEGAQAYGHGLYFAESEPIAQHYRQKLSAINSTPLEEALMTMDGSPAAQAKFDNDVRQAVSFASTSSSAEGAARDFAAFTGRDVTPELVDAFERAMAEKGRMYEVNIQGSPDEFINYDARLDEQSDLVKDVLGTGVETAAARLQRAYTNEMFGGDMIGQDRATPREVSQGLLSKGIKGIRYLDASSRGMGYKINLSRKGEPYETEPIEAGSRRQAEALAKEYQEKGFDTSIEAIGNRNMVVFDDRLVEIVRKYGIAGAAALLGVSTADVQGALAQGQGAQNQRGLLD
jgi:hypothetical protein